MKKTEFNQNNFNSIKWDEELYKHCKFLNFSIEGKHIESDFINCTFENIECYWGLYNMLNFTDCTFKNCTFKGSSFSDCEFVKCQLNNCQFTKDNLDGDCSFDNTKAYNCKLSNTVGFNVQISNA